MEKATIQDVALAAGVSKSTMSRFLNQNYSHMSAKTRQRIANTVKEMGYRPNRRAQSLKTNHSRLIGIMIADISNIYVSLLLKGIDSYLKTLGYQMIIMESSNSVVQEKEQLEQLLDQSVEGIILQPNSRQSADYDFIAAEKVPMVLVDRETSPLQWDTIVTNNYSASQYLGQLGQISGQKYTMGIFISENIKAVSTREHRLAGFKVGIAPLPVEVIEYDENQAEIQKQLSVLIASGEHPLIFAANGKVLTGVLRICQNLKLSIPEQAGVTGYDDWNWAGLVNPGISAVEQYPDYIGRLSAEILMDLMQGRNREPAAKVHTLSADVMDRYSI